MTAIKKKDDNKLLDNGEIHLFRGGLRGENSIRNKNLDDDIIIDHLEVELPGRSDMVIEDVDPRFRNHNYLFFDSEVESISAS